MPVPEFPDFRPIELEDITIISSEDFAVFEALYRWKQLSINRICCKNLWSGYEYINREQDLGEKCLRDAKLSHTPAFLVEKYTITLDKNSDAEKYNGQEKLRGKVYRRNKES